MIHDKREIIPKCVVLVSDVNLKFYVYVHVLFLLCRRLGGGGTPATMACTMTTDKALTSNGIVCLQFAGHRAKRLSSNESKANSVPTICPVTMPRD